MHHQKKTRVFRFVYYLIIFNIGGHDGSVFGRISRKLCNISERKNWHACSPIDPAKWSVHRAASFDSVAKRTRARDVE